MAPWPRAGPSGQAAVAAGFADGPKAVTNLILLDEQLLDPELVVALAGDALHTADPDLALNNLERLFWDIPVDETEKILGLNQADFYGFDVEKLQVIADRVGPSPADLGQTDDSVRGKWDRYREAGRPWLTGVEVAQ